MKTLLLSILVFTFSVASQAAFKVLETPHGFNIYADQPSEKVVETLALHYSSESARIERSWHYCRVGLFSVFGMMFLFSSRL